MFRGSDQLDQVVSLLEEREVCLWHACQLREFNAYMDLGGIASRSLLEQAGVEFTRQQSDAGDRANGVWDKVFGNLEDIGRVFARGGEATPNVYGPIVLQIRPAAIRRAKDVAVTLWSGASTNHDRSTGSLATIQELDRVFLHSASAPFPHRSLVRYKDLLREAFAPRFPDAASVELSLTIDRDSLSLRDLVAVWVDPIVIEGRRLIDLVRPALAASGWPRPIMERSVIPERAIVLEEVVRYLTDRIGPPRLRLLLGRADISETTKDWAAALLGRDLDWLFERYARYLVEGTLDLALSGPHPEAMREDSPRGALVGALRDPADLPFLPS